MSMSAAVEERAARVALASKLAVSSHLDAGDWLKLLVVQACKGDADDVQAELARHRRDLRRQRVAALNRLNGHDS
jgi:hypothetical protein